ncbi:hypothetical protein NEOLEDRAFT_1172586 [Neolentinus lepideus HHB14362 ss-1]|uniref:Uncharacterized protein n=1 Tax=Neolentinus lepideus HHB14362 ss-1 TaxID=1314782 RepID=A0A165NZ16_9AGAM|nr:hypothetical protein NEOLEDRAFT_1172586 [Neolentinus lepideus HHB14362 ss-1]
MSFQPALLRETMSNCITAKFNLPGLQLTIIENELKHAKDPGVGPGILGNLEPLLNTVREGSTNSAVDLLQLKGLLASMVRHLEQRPAVKSQPRDYAARDGQVATRRPAHATQDGGQAVVISLADTARFSPSLETVHVARKILLRIENYYADAVGCKLL